MSEITIFEKRFVNQNDPDIIVSFQLSQNAWNTLRRTKYWKKVEKILKNQKMQEVK